MSLWALFWRHHYSVRSHKTPVWSKIFGPVSYSDWCLIVNFALKFADFVTMATGVGVREVWLAPLIWSTHKTPLQLEISWSNILCKLSYSHFSAEIRTFSSSWQQGVDVSKLWLSPSSRLTPKTLLDASMLVLCLVKASYCQLCDKIRKFSLPWQQGRLTKFVWHP